MNEIESELIVLSYALLNGPIEDLGVQPADFSVTEHRLVFQAALEMRREKLQVDFATLITRTGVDPLVLMPATVAVTVNVTEHAAVVIDQSQRRQLVKTASDMVRAANSRAPIGAEFSQEYVQRIKSITNRETLTGTRTLADAISETLIYINERKLDPRPVWGYPTGFKSYDLVTGGLHGGQLTFWGGGPGVGKTRSMVQGLIHMAQQDDAPNIHFVSLEMSDVEVLLRVLSDRLKIPIRRMNTGSITDDELWDIEKAGDEINKLRITIDSRPTTLDQLSDRIGRLQERGFGQGVIAVDYASLMDVPKAKDRNEATAIIGRGLKQIARQTGCVVWGISSVNKGGMDNQESKMTDMSGSGEGIHAGDVIFFLTKHSDKILANQGYIQGRFVKGRHLPAMPVLTFASLTPGVPELTDVTEKMSTVDIDSATR